MATSLPLSFGLSSLSVYNLFRGFDYKSLPVRGIGPNKDRKVSFVFFIYSCSTVKQLKNKIPPSFIQQLTDQVMQ
jgi:hypothetical protein